MNTKSVNFGIIVKEDLTEIEKEIHFRRFQEIFN